METYINGIDKLPGDIYTLRGQRAALIRPHGRMYRDGKGDVRLYGLNDEFTVHLFKNARARKCATKALKTLSAAKRAAENFLSE